MKRPIAAYYGGKWSIAPWIVENLPEHKVYVEPFCGMASVLLRKPRAPLNEVINDVNGDVVNLFRVLRDDGDELLRLLELTPWSRDEHELARGLSAADLSDMERARRYMVLLQMSHSSAFGDFRARSTRSAKSHAMAFVNLPPKIAYAVERLRGVVIENQDAHKVIAQHDSAETLYYVDPPYLGETRTGSKYKKDMRHRAAHAELLDLLRATNGNVVLSGYASDLYAERLADWQCVTRNAAGNYGRTKTECLWIKRTSVRSGN